jgi:DNA-binding NtrC family response regulator
MCPAHSSVRVLLVDDDPGTLALSVALLSARRCQVRASVDPTTALAMAAEFRPHVLVTDVAMPAMLGVELACRIVEMVPTCRVVFHTGELGLLRNCPLSAALPCFTVLEKPATAHDLVREVLGYSLRKRPPSSVRVCRVEAPGSKTRFMR